MKNYFSAIVLFATLFIGQAFTSPEKVVCNTPQNASTVSINQGDISFDWDDCLGGCTEFKVKYFRENDSYWSSEFNTSISSYSFTGLPSGTYNFYFATVCGGQASSFIIIEETINY